MGLFPAIVTLHLLGGYTLLALLVWQAVRGGRLYGLVAAPTVVSSAMRTGVAVAVLVLVLQAASGAWVSTNYAVLACTEFPKCQGVWWPDMDFVQAFQLWRPLGLDAQGESISFQAITAIHFVHRLAAVVTVAVLLALAARLYRTPAMRTAAQWLAALVLLQVATGLSNVVLGWPLVAAVAHTGGAAAMVGVLVWVLARTSASAAVPARSAAQASLSPAASGVRE